MIFASVMPLAWKAEPDARTAEMMETEKSRCVGRGSRPGSRLPVDRAERVPCQRLQGEELRGHAQIPRPPETGANRIGRSKPPNWINGKNGRQFLIEKAKS